MMLQYFEGLTQGLEAKLAEGSSKYVARKRYALEVARLGVKLFHPDSRVAWCGIAVPFDLLNAMGVTSCYVEFVGAMLASTGGVEPMLEVAEQNGYSTDSCSYHRSVLGAASQGLMPEPDFLVGTSAPCAGGLAVIENLAKHFDKPLHVIHIPAHRGPEAVRYLAEQYRTTADFVAEHSGRPLDMDAVRVALERTNQMRELMVEINRLAAHTPTPARRKDMINLGIVLALFYGTEGGLEVAQAYRDELAQVLERRPADAPRELVRLMWLQNRIQFKHPLLDFLYDDLGAAVVADELNDVPWEPLDPDEPFVGMAKRALSIPLVGKVDMRIERLRVLARQNQVDGAINPTQWGCRQGSGARGLIRDALRSDGVPVLNLEVDCVDPRSFAEGQLKTRLEAFVEMLSN
jgi:benzoyl-CoA reductase/2-hydroxyglutaryl-CoA dehydratase subunit BcrC/BadD/HgdB